MFPRVRARAALTVENSQHALGSSATFQRYSGDFKAYLSRDEAIQRLLTPNELEAAFDARSPLKHIDVIYRRVFGET